MTEVICAHRDRGFDREGYCVCKVCGWPLKILHGRYGYRIPQGKAAVKCGCKVHRSRGYSDSIIFCPLHAAAEEMLKFLKSNDDCHCYKAPSALKISDRCAQCRLIAKAEGCHE